MVGATTFYVLGVRAQRLSVALITTSLSDFRTQEQSANVNSLSAIVSLIRDCVCATQLQLIGSWITVILQHGADPEVQTYRYTCTSKYTKILNYLKRARR